MPDKVNAWAEVVKIPTYKIGAPDKNPMFLEKRVYQGSSGAVYPHPVIDRVFDEKEDKEYTALYLENRYLKIMILPELGGRVQMALDKTNGYHFVYYNHVIKPALVGLNLIGPNTTAPAPLIHWIGELNRTTMAVRLSGVQRSRRCSTPRVCMDLPFTLTVPIWKFVSSFTTALLNRRLFYGGLTLRCRSTTSINLCSRQMSMP
jgi:hypothetical protein